MLTAGLPAPAPLLEDIRLVVADMDGTLLAETGAVPDAFWPLLDRLDEHGIVFAPASGRPYPALADFFGDAAARLAMIAENGALVMRRGEEVSSATLERGFVEHAVAVMRGLPESCDMGLLLSGRDRAYAERDDPAFLAEAGRFYTTLEVVDDLLAVTEPPLKLAVHDFVGAAAGGQALLAEAFAPYQVLMSSQHWYDIMDPQVDKGVALGALRRSLGIGRDQTVVFGDYLNDLGMMSQATHTYAMANAHPEVREACRYVAPSNREHGVVTTLTSLLSAGSVPAPPRPE